MTKIKNTKKGMAKKTLSMSLVVAMLATSNVPVWAAEFSDGSDAAVATEADAFSTEADVPAVDDTDSAAAQTEADGVSTDANVSIKNLVIPKSVTYGETIQASGTLVTNITGTEADYTGDWIAAWRVAGENENFWKATVNNSTWSNQIQLPTASDTYKKYAGKTLELHFYADDNNGKFDITVGKVEVKARDTKGYYFDFALRNNGVYDGKEFTAADLKVNSIKNGSTTVLSGNDVTKYFKITAQNAKNAGDKFIIYATAKDKLDDGSANPYTGTISQTFEIQAKSYDSAKDFVVKYEKDAKYEYTGDAIQPELSKITLTESKTEKDDDGLLSGADLSSAIEAIETQNTQGCNNDQVGPKNVIITLDTSKLTNFKNVTPSTLTISNAFEITKLDLSTCTATIPTITTGTAVNEITPVFYKGDKKLSLKSGDYKLIVSDDKGNKYEGAQVLPTTGNYTADIYYNGNNTTGNIKSVSFNTSVITVNSVTPEKPVSKEYTGKEIKPTATDFGKLTVSYKTTTSNGSATSTASETLQSGEWEITGYSSDVTNAGDKHYATIKVNKTGSPLKDQTFNLYYTITPLTITAADVTLQEKVILDKSYSKASEYALPVTVVAKSKDRKATIATLSSSDYTVDYKFMNGSAAGKNTVGHQIFATVTITNPNFVGNLNAKKLVVTSEKGTKLVSGLLDDSNIVMNKSSYVYTGGKIAPDFKVMIGTLELEKDTDYVIKDVENAVNVGTATLVIEGKGKYAGSTAKATFEITPANIEDVSIVVKGAKYRGGKQVRPDVDKTDDNGTLKVTLNKNDITSQFEVTAYGANNTAGKGAGSVTVQVLKNSKNFTGATKTSTFDIEAAKLEGKLHVYDEHGTEITSANLDKQFTYDGTEKKFASVKFVPTGDYANLVTSDDYEIKYVNNIYGDTNGKGSVIVVAKEGSNFVGDSKNVVKDYVNDSEIKGYADKVDFKIGNLKFDGTNVTVKNGVYAGGLPVKPQVLVQFGGKTLEEGKDYKITVDTYTDVTTKAVYSIIIDGLNGYKGSIATSSAPSTASTHIPTWGIDKQTIANCDVTVKDGKAVVLNGTVRVPESEYTVTKNADDTYTVAAKSTSKNYTGSKTVKAEGKAENEKPDAPMISSVKVVGNKATAILSGDSEGAAGYDYVISTDRDCITNKDYDSVNKNQVQTSTTFKYVQQGTYYAYCHAWKRDANGKKVFSDWSNAYPFVVSAITPDAPVITNVTVSGSTIKVTYKAAANATGYDVVLGTDSKKENGETRPYHYGNHKVLNLKEGTVTATFKKVPKGTWVVGMHAFNRTSEDGKKVFSPWSNLKKATVK